MIKNIQFEILPLRPFTLEDIMPIITGYETQEIYTVEKTESDFQTIFDILLINLVNPYRASFYEDFNPEDLLRYQSLITQGYSFGAYQKGDLIAFTLVEVFPQERLLRVWEFHVKDEFRRKGVGRALMEQVITIAQQHQIAMIMLENQNTNGPAVRFYRSLGFTIHAIDLSYYFYLDDAEASQVAFFMKRKLESPSTMLLGSS
jgi:ribosomal protein S18 acetylase RimI-like enzyme